ncbi:MAG: molybdopterin-dependent oxidoreductase, partial [Chromatiales bacterium]|nr:molybdopterin-dependent oxidoreductase [Chromatiales bacterium]
MESSPNVIRTMCPMNCHPTLCGMKATVENGELVGIEGDADNPDSQGFLCMRGRASKEIIGNTERLLYPMVRDQRGTDSWRRASWDEVVERIGAKLDSIAPEEFGLWMGHGDSATNNGTRSGGQLAKRFAHLHGSQWWHPAMICWGLGGFGLGITGVLEVNTKEDMSANADLIILWGANIASQPNTGRHLKAAKKRGARIITIDIRDSEATARADQHYRIAPGTDAALALAMMHIMVNDHLTDNDFIAQHTLGFEALRAHIQQFPPEWGAQQTGLTAKEIVRLAHDYAGVTRATIVMGGSSMHRGVNGWNSARAIACLPALTGKLGIQGGGLGERHGAGTHGHGLNTLEPDGPSACADIIPDQMASMLDAFEAGRIKALLLNGTNMLSSFSDVNRAERGLDNVDLIVCIDLFMNETLRRQADIILPATAWLEQLGAKMTHTHLYLMEQALEPAGECRTFSQILRALALRLGIDNFFPWADDAAMYDVLFDHP